ncbi:MAG TPA: PilN domain-containing protein [Pyrinomonadaceae bacterium]|nr:PilN domain-containing protein [Pyrinomonadaceae bacterium]
MIKVNLLDSVTERQRGAGAAVEERVANPRARMMMMAGAVFGLGLLAMFFDYYSAGAARARADEELARQQQIAAQMAAINKERAELEKKIGAIQSRIEAIKKLRSSQQGPVALLSALNERLPGAPEFRLETVEQKNGELLIEGSSPNEYAVTQFGRSLEFSSGLFQNVSIETQRKTVEINPADYNAADGPVDPDYKPETVTFKIKCRYGAPAEQQQQSAAAAPAAPANQVAQR